MKMQKLFAVMLAMGMMFSFAACGKTEQPAGDNLDSKAQNETASVWDSALYTEDTRLGEGEKTVLLTVIAEEKQVVITVKTDAETLGDALIENGLIEGEEGSWGMYVKSVDGIRADYDLDGFWWSLEADGVATTYGVDGRTLSAEKDNVYSFVRTPA